MKREVFALITTLLILNILAVAVMADQGSDSVGVSASASVSASDSSNSSVRSEDSMTALRQRMMNETAQIRDERRQLLNDTQKIIDERRAMMNETRDIRENITDMLEQRREMIQSFEERLREQNGVWMEGNRTMMINQLNESQKELIAARINARTGLNLTAENITGYGEALRAILSNGNFAEIRVMPDAATRTALERLQARCDAANCSVELKEVGTGNNTRAAYQVNTEKTSRLFFLFPVRMAVQAQVDSQTGQVISVSKPWWAFLTKEDNANETSIQDSVGANADTSVNASLDNSSVSATANVTAQANVSANTSV